MDRWTVGWMDGWMDGSMDGWMDRWIDGWVCECGWEKEQPKEVNTYVLFFLQNQNKRSARTPITTTALATMADNNKVSSLLLPILSSESWNLTKRTALKQSSVWLQKFLVAFPDWLKNILPYFIQPIRGKVKWVSMHLFSGIWLANLWILSKLLSDWPQTHRTRFFVLVLG